MRTRLCSVKIRTPGAVRTIVFYAHYDGQPLAHKEWATPPFQPTLLNGLLEKDGQIIPLPAPGTPFNPEWRLYARVFISTGTPFQ